jgi:hypothetical protein
MVSCRGPGSYEGLILGKDADVTLGPPKAGDLILFHNTDDTNGNRKADDLYTDAGIILSVDGDRYEFLYLRGEKAALGYVNPRQPYRRRLSADHIENSFIRVIRPDDPPEARYLAGQLLAGFVHL